MVKVLFVCLGNICRSPMAEAVFRYLVVKYGLEKQFLIDSAGTGNWHVGEPPHKGTQGILKTNKIPFDGLKGRQIIPQDLETFDYVIAMDQKNKADLEALIHGEIKTNLITFMSLLEDHPYSDVPDPYFTGNFEEVYDLVSRGAEKLLQYICDKEGISLEKSQH